MFAPEHEPRLRAGHISAKYPADNPRTEFNLERFSGKFEYKREYVSASRTAGLPRRLRFPLNHKT
ncbi:MAG: hypothetical protein COX65_00390 [Elusimicrobia bacterium CG_4_10_14_0_2_um_filter_56_8]|nr:MAG: hypothetical protein AUJ51_04905 [Elusimicrobia bacterium CG1_02_56_21]PJA17828.1 MAG: hypothetical protein COX65_00390 [Elusimicrobia bacterium CG_4_10_14_0_2_um_filter_56_8]